MPVAHMLLNLREYHRPADAGVEGGLERTLQLLSRADPRTVPLAGGDTLLGSADPTVQAVVDLQGLGLDVIIGTGGGRLGIGAMVTRAALAHHEAARTHYHGILAAGSRHWSGNVQRNRATVGGAVATAACNDPLVVALLACDALVVLGSQKGSRILALADFLLHRAGLLAAPALITEIIVPHPADSTGAALVSVGRTPADAPIVVAAATVTLEEGRCVGARLALGGVADAPLRLPGAEAMLTGQALTPDLLRSAAERASKLVQPAADYRGSAEYRKAMAGVLAERALRQAWQTLTHER